ncbi:MAG: hypothetical protein WBV55_24265 [Candidatus Sulfotelmatobacter sp.]
MICAKNALLKDGSMGNWIDARKVVAPLRGNQLKPGYHEETVINQVR